MACFHPVGMVQSERRGLSEHEVAWRGHGAHPQQSCYLTLTAAADFFDLRGFVPASSLHLRRYSNLEQDL